MQYSHEKDTDKWNRHSVENNLRGEIQTNDEGKNIYDRMDALNVPAVCVTVIGSNDDTWTREYHKDKRDQSIEKPSLFQAASISKTITAVLAMKLLVETGEIGLDEDISPRLKRWHIPNENNFSEKVTLRMLLSHRAGFNIRGFTGYPSTNTNYPDLVTILNGNTKAKEGKTITEYADGEVNSPPIKLMRNPGAMESYDSSGTLVTQLLLEDITGESLEVLFQRHIANPLGMLNSSFDVGFPEKVASRGLAVQRGHLYDGSDVDGGWHRVPEAAAGGLWSTSEDLAKFGKALIDAYQGKEDAILKRETMQKMMKKSHPSATFCLGFQVFESDDNETLLAIGHGGSLPGFKAQFYLLPKQGMGAVVMTNADEGTQLAFELLRSVAHVYKWPTLKSKMKKATELDRKTLECATGSFIASKDRAGTTISGELKLYFKDNKLILDTPYPDLDSKTRRVCELKAESSHQFFNTDFGIEVSFSKDYSEFKAFDLTPKRVTVQPELKNSGVNYQL